MTHSIREYTNADIDGIKECLIELQDFERLMDPNRLKGMEIAHEYLEHLLKVCTEGKGKLFVVEIDGSIIGMISIYIEEDTRHIRKSKKFATITDLIVLPEYRGRGIMKELVAKAEEYVAEKGIKTVYAHVVAENHGLVEGFARNGFKRFEVVLKKIITNSNSTPPRK
jgi:ribosomal protein S18 acetylase RimI-like enzyme